MNKVLSIMVVFLACLIVSEAGFIACPNICSCPLDIRGRREVLCYQGGMTDPLPVLEMPSETEIIKVEAPHEKPNSLTLGPIFRGFKNLEEVHIVNSDIPAIGEHSFWGQKKLYLLNVSYNSIKALTTTNFKGPDKLQILDLSHNYIESSPSAVFRHIKNLKDLNLSYNRLPVLVPRIFFGLVELERLDLSFNPLGKLDAHRLSDLPNLKEFRCSGCGILTLNEELLKEMPQLESLDLSNNRFTTMPPVNILFHLSVLNLDGNHISGIMKHQLNGIPLKDLSISHNRISTIEPQSFSNTSISTLDISYNRVNELKPNVLENVISQLRAIDFSGNSLHISQLEKILPRAKHIRSLNIGDLGITKLPAELLKRSRHIKYLNVSSNYLSKFPPEFLYSTPNLRTLDLSSNSLRGLTQRLVTAFSAMPFLTSIRLERNPWVCEECHIVHLMRWLKSNPKQTHSAESCRANPSSTLCLKCIGPKNLAGLPITLLEEEQVLECSTISQSIWYNWQTEGKRAIFQGDQPHLLAGEVSTPNNIEMVAAFFKDHLALVVGVGCGLILALLLVVVTAVACSKQTSAHYYTSEKDIDNKEKLIGANNNGNTDPTVEVVKSPPYEPMAISKVHARTPICLNPRAAEASGEAIVFFKKKSSITTIPEINTSGAQEEEEVFSDSSV